MRYLLFGLLISSSSIFANMGPQGFGQFPNYYFVETGTLGGGGILLALKTASFSRIYSMDIEPSHVNYCKARFKKIPHIKIVTGNSEYDLGKLIAPLNKPITFFLDAHNGSPVEGAKNTPLLEELEQIKQHPIKTHTILIDDMHCCGTLFFDYLTKEDLIAKILEINPNYTIDYVAGGDEGEYPNNVMVARIL